MTEDTLPPLFGSSPRTYSLQWSPDAKPLAGLAGWTRGALFLYALVSVPFLVYIVIEAWLLMRATSGDLSPEMAEMAAPIEIAGGVLGLVVTGANLGAIILVCRFTYRAMKNLWLIHAVGADTSPGWAVGWYFIPFANLVKPAQAMRQIWRASHEPRGGGDTPPLLSLWWACWIISNILGNISTQLTIRSGGFGEAITNYDMYTAGLVVDAIVAPISIASALLLRAIVGGVAAAQERQRQQAVF
jgi:hypothetical protein